MPTDVTTSRNPLVLAVVIGLIILLAVPVLVMMTMMPMMGFQSGMWDGGTMLNPIFGLAMMLLFVLVLVGIGYGLYRVVADHAASTQDRALEELRVAYARGDLSDEEFEKRRETLDGDER